jgi:phosphohistidine phosphatase
MKTLYVLRHAKAERDSATGKDFDRPLAARGWSDAERIGREAKARGLRMDAVLASPAKRAAETLEAFARGYGGIAPEWEPAIYNALVDRLIEIVQGTDDEIERLMIVGHNPGFEGLVWSLADHGADFVKDGMPTAALAAIELPVDRWSDIAERSGRVTEFIAPSDLRA